jgi:uncharacterized protein (TIGR00369 family)
MPIKESFEKALRLSVEAAPVYNLLQIRLDRIDTGFASFRMPFRSELTQVNAIVHGGVIATLADTAVAFALMTLTERGGKVATVEFKINFLASVDRGEMIAEARVVHKGKRLALAEMEVKDETGRLIAKGTATYVIIGPPSAP